jgi:general secretion pathway protein A
MLLQQTASVLNSAPVPEPERRGQTGYLSHFGLTRAPFGTAPDPAFAVETRAHEIALLKIQDAVEQRLGLCLLKGPIGAGKSTIAYLLVRAWASRPEEFTVAYLSDPSAPTPAQFLRLLVGSFGLEPSRYAQDNKAQLRALLLDEYEAGRTVVVIVDEAQMVSGPNLGTLQQLSNEQTQNTKLIQIALLAQPSIDAKLARHAALASRIARRSVLEPLVLEEVTALITHRVGIAGGDARRLLPTSLHPRIMSASRGIPRRVCILCDNALFNAYVRGKWSVDEDSLQDAIRECEFSSEEPESHA